ncbi:MAG: hypothetical protein JJE52_00490 [Acidimicrobiia bacterium]|nr:hypothetical protein [Acidimicrobiia bacterium]
MAPEPSDPDEHDAPEEDDAPQGESRIPAPWLPPNFRLPELEAFASIQRHLAAIDLSALRSAQEAIADSAAFRFPEVLAAQDLVAKHFAASMDFSHLMDAQKVIIETSAFTNAFAAQQQWAEALADSIRLPALEDALASSAALAAFTESNRALLDSIADQADLFARITEGINLNLPNVDFSKLLEFVDRWIPANLRGIDDLDAVATISLDEGIPLSWVPRAEIVTDLLEAQRAEDRHAILDTRRGDILDDCEGALEAFTDEWAVQCRAAIAAMRADLIGPAQSHASNIIDSVVLALHGERGRDHAKARAQEDLDDLPLQLAAENLTLRPLFRAFTTWWPTSGVTPPDHFARHPTSHAVGHEGVFAPRSALVAVMLATSLVVQYSPPGEGSAADDSAPTG